MSLTKFLTSRTFFINLILAFVVIIAVLVFAMQGLKSYTRHGQSMPVPDFMGMTVDEIENTAGKSNLKYEIVDSVHVSDARLGAVVDQEPEAGFRVKQNRMVFLTINSTQPEKVLLPKLTDISFRQAQVLAENCGVEIDSISYEPSEYNGLVLRVEQNGSEVIEGDLLLKDSRIDLVIGRDGGNEDIYLPDVTGNNLEMARAVLINSFLNVGATIFDRTVSSPEDSVNAVVWKQYPSTENTRWIGTGTSVDLWLTTDFTKIEQSVFE